MSETSRGAGSHSGDVGSLPTEVLAASLPADGLSSPKSRGSHPTNRVAAARSAALRARNEAHVPALTKEELHTLSVAISGARGLRKSNAVATCEISGRPGSMFCTEVVRECVEPAWEHEAVLSDCSRNASLIFTVWGRGTQGEPDVVLGRVSLQVSRILSGFEGELRLMEAGDGVEAFLRLKAAPVPPLLPSLARQDSNVDRACGARRSSPSVGCKQPPIVSIRRRSVIVGAESGTGRRTSLLFPRRRQSVQVQHQRHRQLPCAEQATLGAGAESAIACTSSANLGMVLEVFKSLLSLHEVKFTLQLLESLTSSAISSCKLPLSRIEIAQEMQGFADRSRSAVSDHSSAAGLLESLLAVGGTAVGGSAASSPLQRGALSGGSAVLPIRRSWEIAPTETPPRMSVTGNKHGVRSVWTADLQYLPAGSKASGKRESRLQVAHVTEPSIGFEALSVVPTEQCDTRGQLPNEGSCMPSSAGSHVVGMADPLVQAPLFVPADDDASSLSSSQSDDKSDDAAETGCRQTACKSIGETVTVVEEEDDEPPSDVKVMLNRSNTAATLYVEAKVDDSDDLDDLSQDQIDWLATPSDEWIVHPNKFLRLSWDLIALVLILFECVALPVAFCFKMHVRNEINWVSTMFFGLDVVLNFNTGYFHGSLLMMRRRWIVLRYLRTWLVLDVVSTLPWELLFALAEDPGGEGSEGGSGSTLLRIAKLGKLMRVLRLLRLAKITSLVLRLQNSGMLPGNLYELKFGMSAVKMFVIFGFLSHWSACVWGWIGDPENVSHASAHDDPIELRTCTMGGPCEAGIEGAPWRQRYGMNNYDTMTQYLVSLQYSAALITGGEAPLQPGRWTERVYTVVMMFCSVFVSSIVVGEILLIMNRQSEQNLVFEENMQQSREFMVCREVPLQLQARVYRYLEAQHRHLAKSSEGGRAFIEHLSQNLQLQLIEHLNRTHICRHPFFKEMDNGGANSQESIRRISLEATPAIFAAGDPVVEEGHLALCAHFLVSGKLSVKKAHAKPLTLKPYCWIGDRCLFVDTLRTNTVLAVGSTETLALAKSSVQAVCIEFPEVQAIYAAFREQVRADDFEGLRCTICHDIGHMAEDCPERQDAKQELDDSPGKGSVVADVARQSAAALSHVSMRVSAVVSVVVSGGSLGSEQLLRTMRNSLRPPKSPSVQPFSGSLSPSVESPTPSRGAD